MKSFAKLSVGYLNLPKQDDLLDSDDDQSANLQVDSDGHLWYTDPDGNQTQLDGAGGSGTVTSIAAGTGLSGGTITDSGTIAIDSTVATLTGTQELTDKTLTAPVMKNGCTASGSSAYDLSGSTGTWKPPTGGVAAAIGSSGGTLELTTTTAGTGLELTDSGFGSPKIRGKNNPTTYISFDGNMFVGAWGGYFLPQAGMYIGHPSSGLPGGMISKWYSNSVGAQLTAAATITPTEGCHHVTGATTIDTIAATNVFNNAELWLIADGGDITISSSGNVKTAVTITQNKAQKFVYVLADLKWYVQQ